MFGIKRISVTTHFSVAELAIESPVQSIADYANYACINLSCDASGYTSGYTLTLAV